MTKYRVVQRDNGYMPQKRTFFIWQDFYLSWQPCGSLERAIEVIEKKQALKMKLPSKIVWRSWK